MVSTLLEEYGKRRLVQVFAAWSDDAPACKAVDRSFAGKARDLNGIGIGWGGAGGGGGLGR